MKKINWPLYTKRFALTGVIATPTGLLIDHWVNDKDPAEPELLLNGGDDSNVKMLETTITDQADKISELQNLQDEKDDEINRLKKELEESDKQRAEDINNFADEIIEKSEEIENLKVALNDGLRQIGEVKKQLEIEKSINAAIDKDRDKQTAKIKELEEDLKSKSAWVKNYQTVSKQHIAEIGRLAKENKNLKDKLKEYENSWKCLNPTYDKHPQKEIYGKYCDHPDQTKTLRFDIKEGSRWNIQIKNEWFNK